MTRSRLALAWPTYNRPQEMSANLAAILPEALALGVAIHVSDDSPDMATQAVVHAAAAAGDPGIHYRSNSPALGHDANLIATLTWPDADYVWLLGDKLHPTPGMLAELLRFLDGQDLVFVNHHSDDQRMIPAAAGEAARALTLDALWHQTLTGATIYSQAVCKRAGQIHIWPNFPQVSTILDRVGNDPVTVGWFGKKALTAVENAGASYWRARMIEVFAHDWAAVVTAFPKAVPAAERVRVIRSHSLRMNLFNFRALVDLKNAGLLRWSVVKQPWFWQAMHMPRWTFLLLLLPGALLNVLLQIHGTLKSLRN